MGSKNVSQILEIINNLVQKHRLLSGKFDNKEKVISFQHPTDLEKIFNLDIKKKGLSDEELEKVCEDVIQYSVKTCHSNFYNQLYHGVDEYGLAGTWLSEALNTNNHTFEVAPVFIVVEHAVINYAKALFGWGSQGDGIFSPGGSLSNMYGMMVARHSLFPQIKTKGVSSLAPLVAFTSEESHYSIVKGANWLGLGTENVIKIKTDDQGRMIPEELERSIADSRREGKLPFFVNATAGSTVIGAYDDLRKLSSICRENKIWLHVDGAWGGSAIMSAKRKYLLDGSENVDSIAWNPHKMVGAPLQTSLFIVRHKGILHETNSASATYLFQQDKFYDVSYDTGDKSVQCGRKVDAFKFWFMLQARGKDFLEEGIDAAFDCADKLQEMVVEREGFRLVPAFQERQCANVGFWYIPPSLRGQEETEAWWDRIEKIAPKIKELMIKEGSMMIGYQPLAYKNYRNFFRMVIHSTPRPTEENMIAVLDEIERIGKNM